MGMLKGQREFDRFKMGGKLTWKSVVLAQCYVCNGENEGGIDCQGYSCPLYAFPPYKNVKTPQDDRILVEMTNA